MQGAARWCGLATCRLLAARVSIQFEECALQVWLAAIWCSLRCLKSRPSKVRASSARVIREAGRLSRKLLSNVACASAAELLDMDMDFDPALDDFLPPSPLM